MATPPPRRRQSARRLRLRVASRAGHARCLQRLPLCATHRPTATVATYAYANPVVAVAIGTLLLGEHLHPTTLIAGTVIVAAVALTITDQTRKRQPGKAPQQTISSSRSSRAWRSPRS
jgi:hypothetical protein